MIVVTIRYFDSFNMIHDDYVFLALPRTGEFIVLDSEHHERMTYEVKEVVYTSKAIVLLVKLAQTRLHW